MYICFATEPLGQPPCAHPGPQHHEVRAHAQPIEDDVELASALYQSAKETLEGALEDLDIPDTTLESHYLGYVQARRSFRTALGFPEATQTAVAGLQAIPAAAPRAEPTSMVGAGMIAEQAVIQEEINRINQEKIPLLKKKIQLEGKILDLGGRDDSPSICEQMGRESVTYPVPEMRKEAQRLQKRIDDLNNFLMQLQSRISS